MRILHLSCSPRGRTAESYQLSQKIVDHLLRNEPAARVIERDIGGGAIAHIDANHAAAQHTLSAAVGKDGAASQSEVLVQELESSDVLVIGTPMHNLSVPSTLKAWLDHIVCAGRTFNVTPAGKVGLLSDRPVFVAVSSGGVFSGERARQPDFLTPYLKIVLGTIGLRNVSFFTVEGTGHGQPALRAARAETDQKMQEHFSHMEPTLPTRYAA